MRPFHNLRMNTRWLAALLLAPFLSSSVEAQEMTPRAYWPAPKGTQVLTMGLAYTDGDIVPDPSLPITGIDSEITTMVVGYLQTIDLFGRTANVIVELPYSDGTTTAQHPELGAIERDYKGVGDIAATLQVNLLGAPTMDKEGFAALRHDPHLIVGASLKVVAPTGKHDEDRVVNVSPDRWAAKAEIGSIIPLTQKWLLELEAGAWFFEDNDNFLGDRTREQDPIYSIQAHLVHRFSPGFWVSLDATGYRGGRSTLDGVRLEDLQRDSKVGITGVFPFSIGRAIKVSYTTGSVNDSEERFDVYTVSYQHLF
jgi:hypothetical protein